MRPSLQTVILISPITWLKPYITFICITSPKQIQVLCADCKLTQRRDKGWINIKRKKQVNNSERHRDLMTKILIRQIENGEETRMVLTTYNVINFLTSTFLRKHVGWKKCVWSYHEGAMIKMQTFQTIHFPNNLT